MSTTDGGRVEVALAEYTALRAEILTRLSAQTTLVGVCLTAVGVVFGLALRKREFRPRYS